MRIGIDARFYGPIGKGLGRYTQKLIENLEKVSAQGGSALGGNDQYFIFLRKDNIAEYKPKNKNFKKVLADFPWYSWQEQLKFPRLLNKYDLDLVHFPHFNVPFFYFGKFVVTIHDLILIHFPTVRSTTLNPLFYWFKFFIYKIVIQSAILRSNRIISVSRFTKRDILENYRSIPNEKIRVTHEACEDYCMLSPNKDNEIIARYGIIKPYIMYVGNAYPHKNLERLVLAFKELQKTKKELKLVLIGKMDYFYSRLKLIVREKKIRNVLFLGYVPDYELDTIFRNASAYVFPSLYEGFGLPPLEAMAKGTPVISSDHPCMREILEESAHFFDAANKMKIVEGIREVLEDENLRNDLIKKGYEQIKKYSWKKMARETLEVYKSIKI